MSSRIIGAPGHARTAPMTPGAATAHDRQPRCRSPHLRSRTSTPRCHPRRGARRRARQRCWRPRSPRRPRRPQRPRSRPATPANGAPASGSTQADRHRQTRFDEQAQPTTPHHPGWGPIRLSHDLPPGQGAEHRSKIVPCWESPLAQCESGGNWNIKHRQRLLRWPAVQRQHLARLRRQRLRVRRQPRAADRRGRAGTRRAGLGRVARVLAQGRRVQPGGLAAAGVSEGCAHAGCARM